MLGVCVLTLENIEAINFMVAKVLGGSFASKPSNALDNETVRRSMNSLPPPRWTSFIEEGERDVRSSERMTNDMDFTAISNWWVAVIWADKHDKR